jgi:hypothetical protein
MAKTTKKPAAKKAAKKPTAKQLAARKKFAAMAKAKAKAVKAKKPAAKKVAAKKTASKAYQTGSSNKLYDAMKKAKGPGKRVSASGGVYYERRKNRSDMPGSILGIDENIRLTRINNDVNGNPRYVAHFMDFLNDEENTFLPFNKMYEYALKKAKKIGGKKFHNKQYGGGIVFQSYNTDELRKNIVNLKNTTPKIKF